MGGQGTHSFGMDGILFSSLPTSLFKIGGRWKAISFFLQLPSPLKWHPSN
jgi:hypothetical protein